MIECSPHLISFVEGFLSVQGIPPRDIHWHPLAGGGSDRRLYRLSYPGGSFIVAVNENPPGNSRGVNENDSFSYICNHLRSRGFAVPAIHAFQKERGWFILEDVGEVHLQDKALLLKGNPAALEALYRQVLELLPHIQVKGAEGFDTSRIHSPPYDKAFVRRWESGYFLQFFVNLYCQRKVSEDHLADELDTLAERLSGVNGAFFLYRDFQSKNIMITHEQVRLLDFQGARKGPLHYDLASLLLDPYVDIGLELQANLLHYYLEQLNRLIPVDTADFLDDYDFIALHRNMQILGAFACLCMVKGKKEFSSYIPAALRSLKNLLARNTFAPYEKLRIIVDAL